MPHDRALLVAKGAGLPGHFHAVGKGFRVIEWVTRNEFRAHAGA